MKLLRLAPTLALMACAAPEKVLLDHSNPAPLTAAAEAEYRQFSRNAAAVLTPAHLALCLDEVRRDLVDPDGLRLLSSDYRIDATPLDFRSGRARMIVPVEVRLPDGRSVRESLSCHFRFGTLDSPEFAYAVAARA